ncbi:hypothetical protein QDT91_20635 [Mycolicibacterium aubagnense]|uniref:hypothetical protein n=1 Tax=Mycolicibacterium aubagnense TaxID=319707 RepID=UPI0010FE3D47|nr:hypothetical protein [Mycolicibacterium aubagnense]TLH66796.1 hypothetical protein C1S80_06930 [Mycolicibacterium aubagnense]WGI31614.1 hypothetical protein QDT91_20635 [Mycolicibacterium aubagnense]
MVMNARTRRRQFVVCAVSLAVAWVGSTTVGLTGVATGDSDQSYDIGYYDAIGRPLGPGKNVEVENLGYAYHLVDNGMEPTQACIQNWQAERVYTNSLVLHPGPVPHNQDNYLAGCQRGLASLGKWWVGSSIVPGR